MLRPPFSASVGVTTGVTSFDSAATEGTFVEVGFELAWSTADLEMFTETSGYKGCPLMLYA